MICVFLPIRYCLAKRRPASQAIWLAGGIYIDADFHEQHGCADQVDTGDGLQKRQGITLLGHSSKQLPVEVRDARLDFLDVMHRFVEDEAMARRQLAPKAPNSSSRLTLKRLLAKVRTSCMLAPAVRALTIFRQPYRVHR